MAQTDLLCVTNKKVISIVSLIPRYIPPGKKLFFFFKRVYKIDNCKPTFLNWILGLMIEAAVQAMIEEQMNNIDPQVNFVVYANFVFFYF